MSDPVKVRLVRCPKCENLLPELQGYNVYQCGGCGAILRAQTINLKMDSLSQRSDEERVQLVEENFPIKPDDFIFPLESRNLKEGSNKEIRSSDSFGKKDEKSIGQKWVVYDDLNRNETLHGYAHAKSEREYRVLESSNATIIGPQRSESFGDWKGINGFVGNQKQNIQHVKYSTSYYRDGPSNYLLRPNYGCRDQINNRNGADEVSKVEYLEQDRAELLKKLDELKEQINRSCDINEKSEEKFPLNPVMTRPEVNYRDKHPYANQYNKTSPYNGQHEIGMCNRYYDPLSSQMLRTPHQEPNLHLSGNCLHNKTDPYQQPYPKDINLYHPHCSCVHCYNHHSTLGQSIPSTSFQGIYLPQEPYNSILYQHDNQRSCGLLDYNAKAMNSNGLGTHNLQSHTGGTNDFNANMYGYGSRPPQRAVMTTRRRHCRPLAGGAPLVSCHNCYLLLEIPTKFSITKKNHVKIKCGACSTIILFAIVDKKLFSVSIEANMTLNLAVKGSDIHSRTQASQANMSFSSEDDENTGNIFHLLDRERQDFGAKKSENKKGLGSASSYSSEHEVTSDFKNPQEVGPISAELKEETIFSPPVAGSPLQDHFDYSSKYRSEKGNDSGRSDKEQTELIKVILRQKSLKDGSLATEMDISFNEDINTGQSFESDEMRKEEDQLPGNNVAQSFFAGIIKKSFKDFPESTNFVEQSSTDVMINGHYIKDKLLKKAEKIAGPVRPGKYWYDSRAGFWGVMGGPCLGIIPPFIEEFSKPMPEDCSNGSTSVFVNGREIHENDLKLLSSRGLPCTGNRSYIIEISGRILDEDTGEELTSLGKLAPTVEKVKHGFGMKVPRVSA